MHEGSTISHDVLYRNVQLQSFLHVECVLGMYDQHRHTVRDFTNSVHFSVSFDLTSDTNAFKDLDIVHEILRQLSRVHEQCHQDGM